MRTTVTISDDLLTEAKVLAARQRRTLGAVIDDALRAALAMPTTVRLPTSGRGTDVPLVDVTDREALADVLGDNDAQSAGAA